MKILLCTGDSHTWGQGAAGALDGLDPAAQAGDRRPTQFESGSYVNRIRRAVAEATGSSFAEWNKDMLASMTGRAATVDGVALNGEMTLSFTGQLIRLFWRRTAAPCTVTVRLDGKPCGTWPLTCDDTGWGFYGVKNIPVFASVGAHTLTLSATGAAAYLFRAEVYDGAWAVLNAGIGSCPASRYLREYWEDEVAAYHPDIVLAEAHTINDWLSAITPAGYEQVLTEYVARIRKLSAVPLLMTVSPVMSAQVCCDAIAPYEEYVRASRRAARSADCPLIDAHAAIARQYAALPADTRRAQMFDDDWHVSAIGHDIYARCAMRRIRPLL